MSNNDREQRAVERAEARYGLRPRTAETICCRCGAVLTEDQRAYPMFAEDGIVCDNCIDDKTQSWWDTISVEDY